jgi:tRNA(Ile)-lysidine synthase
MGPAPAVAAVRLAVRRALTSVAAGELVLVACSGGADSLALAAAAAHEARTGGNRRWRVGAVTVDHGLQDDSAVRARHVAATSVRLGFDPVEVVAVVVGTAGGPEAAARTSRYRALNAAATRHRAAAVLLGHTLDDQAETVLLGLTRGSGARSLAGMAPQSGIYVRPLLNLPRSTTRDACLAEGLTPWDDPHNQDPAYARVRVRQDVLPVLEKALGPGVAEALARTARLLRDDADALDIWADYAEGASVSDAGLDVAVLAALPRAVRTRLFRRHAIAAGAPATALTAAHVDSIDSLVTDWHGQSWVSLPGSVRAHRQTGHIVFQPAPPAPPAPRVLS